MLDKLKLIEERYEELCIRSEQPDFYADPKQAAKFLKEKSELEPVVTAYRAYSAAQRTMDEALELLAGSPAPALPPLCPAAFSPASGWIRMWRTLTVLYSSR